MYASSARSSGENRSDTCHAFSASIFSSEKPRARHDLQCCENTNWLPTSQPARGLAQLAQLGRDLAVGAGVEREAAARVLQTSGELANTVHQSPGVPGRRPRLGHRIAVAEQPLVHRQDDRRAGLGLGDLTESWHGRTVYEVLVHACPGRRTIA